jgi:Zn-dependent protease with chaperone function
MSPSEPTALPLTPHQDVRPHPSSGIAATYFDGHQSRAHPVCLDIRDGMVFLHGEGVEWSAPLGTVAIGDRLGQAPRLIRLSDGGHCEVADHGAFDALLAAQGIDSSAVSQWEASPKALVASILVFLALLVAGYRYGIPLAARAVADRMPDAVTTAVTRQVLAVLEGQLLEASQLPGTRQQQLAGEFKRLIGAADAGRYELLFRRGPAFGANAFALPSGVIVVTDDLVRLALDDREILGVLAHEAGHVVHHHGMRLVVQNSTLTLLVGWYVGDFSSIIAVAPTALLQAKYSRDFEREADAYAADVLLARGISPSVLADILERIESDARPGAPPDRAPHGAPPPNPPGESGSPPVGDAPGTILDYTASHPATNERLEYLRARSRPQ